MNAAAICLCSMHGGRLARQFLFLVLALVLVAGCSKGSRLPEALNPLAHAELVPGMGLGSLRLSENTLAVALEQFGQGRASVVAGDEYGFELTYGGGAVSLLFMATPTCHQQLMRGQVREVADHLQQEGRLPESLSACGASTLASVALAAPEDSTTGFFLGRVADKVGLGSTLDEMLMAQGPSHEIPGVWLAGSRPDETSELHTYDSGLALFTGNAPDGPNEARQVVRKMAIFLPE